MEERIQGLLKKKYGHGIDESTNEELFDVIMQMTRDEMTHHPHVQGDKKLYYISAEFLLGKLLSNNLINLGMYNDVKRVLSAHGKNIEEIEEYENEPSLGNGGLGRLAACFLDSIATLNLPGDGVGLNYHMGLFKQIFSDNLQKEVKNPWIDKDCWLIRNDSISFEVPFRKCTVKSVMYDIDVPGYRTGTKNQLHLFDLDTVDDSIINEGSIDFDKTDIEKNLTLFLYPDDSDRDGRLLRIYQQYFMVSNAAQLIIYEMKQKGFDLHDLSKHVAIQINDTHPSMVIPELIRLLLNEGFTMDEAISEVEKTCAYTNHTILAEALETWPMDYMEEVVPHLIPIIRELDNRVRHKYSDESVRIIDRENRVHMAHMDIHYGHSVNGVAALHTQILEDSELNNFYRIYPEKFNNKTNGITFRRWLVHCNPLLSDYLRSLIGDGFVKNADELEGLLRYKDDDKVLENLYDIKQKNKKALADYFKQVQGEVLNPDSIYDVQVKRLHEYKRQQMNCLYAIHKYLEIKSGKKPARPITMIFGAKAAPAYIIAKDIIHLILCLSELTKSDPDVAPYFRVVMAENYNVTYAGKIIPAADISEQISLASKEASGTSNMKFMLNGAITLGTEDGANVEIRDLVGDDNIYIFGKKKDEIINLYKTNGYDPAKYYADPEIKKLVDFMVGDEIMKAGGNRENLERLHHEMITKDYFMTLIDLKEYIDIKEKVYKDYEDKKSWYRKSLVNIAKAGFFSSDRTIAQYNAEIWKLK